MKTYEIKSVLQAMVTQARDEADVVEGVMPLLPELPAGVDYLGWNGYPFKNLAMFSIDLICQTRAQAVPVVDLFPPVPLKRYEQPPWFRPVPRLPAEMAAEGIDVQPVFFNTYMFSGREGLPTINPADGSIMQWYSKLMWYWQPFAALPGITLAVTITAQNDPTRLMAGEAVALPRGTAMLDPEVTEGENRTGVVYWAANGDPWQEAYLEHAPDEWAGLLEVENEQ